MERLRRCEEAPSERRDADAPASERASPMAPPAPGAGVSRSLGSSRRATKRGAGLRTLSTAEQCRSTGAARLTRSAGAMM